MLNNILELISESYIFSDKNISVDLDKFESGEVNKLLISGLSGAGKTTTGNKLSEKYKVEVIDTDNIYEKINDKYSDDKYTKEFRYDLFVKEFDKLLSNNKKIIISGIGISRIYEDIPKLKELILKSSFIFLGKSALKSSYDAAFRRKNLSDTTFPTYLQWNFVKFYKREQQLKKDRCANSNVKEFEYISEDNNQLYNSGDLTSHIGVSAVIKNSKNQILMLDHVKFNCWTIPIGKAENGQSAEDALRQEIREELGIEIISFTKIHEFSKSYVRNGIPVTVNAEMFLINSYSGKIKNNEPTKHRSIKFMDISEIKKLNNTTDNTKELIKNFKKFDIHI